MLKTFRGDVTVQDWDRFQHKLSTVKMSWDNGRAPLILAHYAGLGVDMDRQQVLDALTVLAERERSDPVNFARLGAVVMNDLGDREHALAFFIKAVEVAPPGDSFPWQLGAELRTAGEEDLAEAVELAGLRRRNEVSLAR